jgi:monovalent cation/hydrogen antiporter
MNLLTTVLLLLVCLLISNVISHYIPFIPTALIQIVLGIIIALSFRNIKVKIESEWFMLLFVAPLLYNDGRRFQLKELWKLRRPILGNAIFLVLLTAIGGGYFIHWMIPKIPIAAAFALAAILSPTDPVAVNGIAKRIQIPENILNLVRGESLINDASGLVAFNYAVAAVVTESFSLKEAVLDFIYMFSMGAILGIIFGMLIMWIKYALRKSGIIDVTFHSLMQILVPFIIYIITEELLHASGVIAVVIAGIIHSLISERTETIVPNEKIVTENIWSIIIFTLNGIVFILLGLNIPSSMGETVVDPNIGNWLALGYVIAIGLVILGIRFIWSILFSYYQYNFVKTEHTDKPSLKTSLLVSLTGVRGAVTMAGVLSIPYFSMSGRAFPERSLILFLAAGVILFTLISATVLLPILSNKAAKEGEILNNMYLTEIRKKLIQESIKKIRLEMNEENEAAAYELMSEYKLMYKKIDRYGDFRETQDYQNEITKIRLLGVKAERKYIHDIRDNKEIDPKILSIFESSLDYREEVLSNSVFTGYKHVLEETFRGFTHFKAQYIKSEEISVDKLRAARNIQLGAFKAAIKALEEYSSKGGRADIANVVILDYKRMINKLKSANLQYNDKKEEQKEELRIKVIDFERCQIRAMYELGEISNKQAKELRRFINYIESVTLYEQVE